MDKRFLYATGWLLAAALVGAACFGGDDDEEDTLPGELEVIAEGEPSEPEVVTEAVAESEPEPAAGEQPADEPEAQAETETEPVTGADRELLAYGESARGSIDEVEEEQQFRFNGEAGDLVRIAVDGKGGMDPIVTLLEPNRTEIAVDDDGGPGRDALLIATLPTSGLQVVRVGAFSADPSSLGDFVISVERLPIDPDDEPSGLTFGGAVAGVLGAPGDEDEFRFDGLAGQSVIIRADGVVGTDTLLELFNPDGSWLAADDDLGHGLDAELTVTLLSSGPHLVRVSAAGNRIGPYVLSLNVAETPEAPDADVAETVEGVAITYLAALQAEDANTLRALAGPELLEIWGWESAADVTLDFARMFRPAGTVSGSSSQLPDERARVFLDLALAEGSHIIRFDLINVDGQWRVDHWKDITPISASG
ncbi:MAG: hypothetical protein V3V06_08400 [Dehalococcoidia bacterium]